jgi:K+-sensing histidine kinase KdpD
MALHYPLVFVLGVVAGYFFPKLMRAVLDNDLVGILSDCALAELRSHLPHRFRGAWKSWGSLAGAGICELAAAVLCLCFRGTAYDSIAVLGFLLVVAGSARHFGPLAGILGSVSAAATFSVFLFEPVGKFGVSSATDQIALAIVVVGGVVLSYYLSSSPAEKHVAAAGASR